MGGLVRDEEHKFSRRGMTPVHANIQVPPLFFIFILFLFTSLFLFLWQVVEPATALRLLKLGEWISREYYCRCLFFWPTHSEPEENKFRQSLRKFNSDQQQDDQKRLFNLGESSTLDYPIFFQSHWIQNLSWKFFSLSCFRKKYI